MKTHDDGELPIASSMLEAQSHLALLLGLETPVSEDAVRAVASDPEYAERLRFASPSDLEALLRAAPKAAESMRGVVKRFSAAIVDWGRDSFSIAPKALYEARVEICRSCPNRTSVLPGHFSESLRLSASICELCGCAISTKARVRGQKCPGEDPVRQGFSRWGDAL